MSFCCQTITLFSFPFLHLDFSKFLLLATRILQLFKGYTYYFRLMLLYIYILCWSFVVPIIINFVCRSFNLKFAFLASAFFIFEFAIITISLVYFRHWWLLQNIVFCLCILRLLIVFTKTKLNGIVERGLYVKVSK